MLRLFSDALLNVLHSINLTAKQLKVILWDAGFSLQMKIRQLEKWVFMCVIMSNILSRTKDATKMTQIHVIRIRYYVSGLYGSCHLRSKLFDITGAFDGVIKIFDYKCK